MGRLENGHKGSGARAVHEKNARYTEHVRQHRLRAAAACGDRVAGADRTWAAFGESRRAAPGGDGAGDSDGDGEFADGDGDSRRPPREAPNGRDDAAGAGCSRGMSGTSHRRARSEGGPGKGLTNMVLRSYSAPRIWISKAEYEYGHEYVYIRQTLGPDGDYPDEDDDSRRVRRRATPASSLPDTQGRSRPGRWSSPPPDAECTRRADAICAEREATVLLYFV
jgi:hypothetical protein